MLMLSRFKCDKSISNSLQLLLIRHNTSSMLGDKKVKIYDEDDESDPLKPIKFSTSEAAGWRAAYSRLGYKPLRSSELPSWKFWACWGSYFVFVTYLLHFREGNDLDEAMDMPLGERVLWIREQSLLMDRKQAIGGNDSFDEDLEKIDALRIKYGYNVSRGSVY